MMSTEDMFGASRLEILVPDERVRLSLLETTSPTWWSDLASRSQRSLAFFDERLYLLLALKIPDNPASISSLLERLQVSLEASYIAPFVPSSQALRSPQPSAANASPQLQGNMSSKLRTAVPVIPPTTPNPVPATSSTDRPYAHADSGVSLQSYIWGDDNPIPSLKNQSSESLSKDEFTIAWSGEEKSWVAIYELHVSVTFLPTRVSEPLLCLTVSATLRDKALLATSHRKILGAALIAKNLPFEYSNNSEAVDSDQEVEDIMHGMAEVNLLTGLNDGVTFNSTELPMSLPSSRVGSTIRRQAFSMAPLFSPFAGPEVLHSPSPSSVLRKSYRKTLRTVEGIKVRMRSCFVPIVPSSALPGGDGDVDVSEENENPGNEERTIVLSVEIDNSTDSGLGFVIERVNITVDGDRAKTVLMGWGSKAPNEIFPFTLLANSQTNLLYTVTSLLPPDRTTLPKQKRQSTMSNGSDGSADGMQRLVTIVVEGHPYRPEDPTQESSVAVHLESFSSRWTCILDLIATQQADPNSWYSRPASPLSAQDVLSTPASPYPANLLSSSYHRDRDRNSHTGTKIYAQKPRPRPVSSPIIPSNAPSVSHRASVGAVLTPAGKFVPSPPSAVVAAMNAQANSAGSPTPRTDRFPAAITGALSSPIPLTPAFPSYSDGPPPTPNSQSPLGPTFDASSLPQEPFRERLGSTIIPAALPPRGGGTTYQGGEMAGNMLVSVTLHPPRRSPDSARRIKQRIYPLDVFSLEVFLLNTSPLVHRCEIGYPEKRRRRQVDPGGKTAVGVMPLDNRIRVGPLFPGSSQSVRIRVLALSPGVHMIEALTLTDVATSYTINLRSVMNVVVEELEQDGTL